MEINKVQWRLIAKGEKLPCDSFLMRKDDTMTSMVTGAGVTVGQDAYYLPVEELRSFPKEESEDDRIRKELIAKVKEQIDCIPVPDCRDKEDEKALKQLNKWLAWLEKQGEQILANSAKTCKDEQKPEADQHSLPVSDDSSLPPFYECIYHPCTEKAYEQKPAEWSEEDEEKIRSIFLGIEAYSPSIIYGNGKEEVLNWLKSLKDRVQPQPKQEWSEEDIKALNRISAILVDASEVKNWWKKNRLIEKDEMIRLTNFLKSLRPQNTWKPSDEQMAALEDAIYHVDDAVATQIAKLIGDLKNI